MDSKVFVAYEDFGLEEVDQDFIDFVLRVVLLTLEKPEQEVGLVVLSDAKIQELNKQYRGKDKPTDVLSFVKEDFPEKFAGDDLNNYLGDIYISRDTLVRQAEEAGISQKDRFAMLFVHGLLHLLGYDHIEDAEAETMETMEEKILGYII
jgi:probable rRNA maturation factor